jgi:replicative DNA helicase
MITNEIKKPPHNEEAEYKLIACCLLDGDYSVYDTVSVIVEPDDFYTLKGKLLFTAIASLVEKGKPLDAISLMENLKASKGLDEVGGMAGIFSVMEEAETPLQALYCAKLVAEKSKLRSLIRGCRVAVEQAESESAESQAIRASLENDILKVDTLGTDTFSVVDSAEEILEDIQKMQDGTFNPDVVKTNINRLDGYLGNNGIAAGEVLTLAAPTSCGKSALALFIATKAMKQDDTPTAYFSFEMPRKQLMKRMIQTVSGINVRNIQDGVASPEQEERFKAVTKESSELPLYTSHSVRNADDLTSQARHLVRKKGVKLVVIDYLQLVPFNGKKMGKAEGIADISHKIKQMALDLNIAVILLAQVNREGAKSERIRLYDLKDSGDIENDADIVLLMYPSKGDFESSKGHDSHGPYTELIYNVAKNREGQRDVGGLFKFYHCTGRFA